MNNNSIIGEIGEIKAGMYLEDNNYEIINKNYRCRFGEIDIIAFDKKTNELVFIEVKSRTNFFYGMPIDAINKQKIKHIKNSINYYIIDKKLSNTDIRIDAIEVFFKGKKCYIHHVKAIL